MDRRQGDPCYDVRKFIIPHSADIGIIVVGVIVILVNGFALISVLRNYRRLRQRIYVFVVSLGVADFLGGAVHFADALNRVIKQADGNSTSQDIFMYKSAERYDGKIIILKQYDRDYEDTEFIEVLKSACITVSVLNTALVTFALYKRTTSMGKHHEDFRNADGSFNADGHPFLPAFDTMMRVLSIGNPAAANGMSKNMAKYNQNFQKNGETRKPSDASRVSYSSTQPDEVGVGSRKPQVVRTSTTENATPRKGIQSTRSSSLSRFVQSGGRKLSQAFRSRSSSGVPSYVGRHSNSVMSKAATRCTLFLVWLAFAAVCVIPLVLHRFGSTPFCSVGCHTSEIVRVHNVTEISDVSSTYTSSNQSGCVAGYQKALSKEDDDRENLLCSSCSAAFFPLSKSHQVFTVAIVLINWTWLITSSARLLYLRKRSSNVFVRCSALWRFMFMVALFYFFTLFPFVLWTIFDYRTASVASQSPLWLDVSSVFDGTQEVTVSNSRLQYVIIDRDSWRLYPNLGSISICFLLLHFAITPSLYLVRLLGFRRIFSIN